jgi:hypothetical protein
MVTVLAGLAKFERGNPRCPKGRRCCRRELAPLVLDPDADDIEAVFSGGE